MSKQFDELQRYYSKKGIRVDIRKNDNGKDCFTINYTNKNPEIIPVLVVFLDMGNHVRIAAICGKVHPSRISDAIAHANDIHAQNSFFRFAVLDDGTITVRNEIPECTPLASVGNVADELVEITKIAVRAHIQYFKTLGEASATGTTRTQTVPPSQKPIHTPKQEQTEDDDWLYDVTKF